MLKGLMGPISESRCSVANFPAVPVSITGGPSTWLKIRLDQHLEIYPRLDPTSGWMHCLDDEGNPLTSYHGTFGKHGLNILKQRLLELGVETTGQKRLAGVWHATPRIAAKYAWPCVWPRCTEHTMLMFELSITAWTKYSEGIYCTRHQGCYAVQAMYLGRLQGKVPDPNKLGFHWTGNGEPYDGDLVDEVSTLAQRDSSSSETNRPSRPVRCDAARNRKYVLRSGQLPNAPFTGRLGTGGQGHLGRLESRAGHQGFGRLRLGHPCRQTGEDGAQGQGRSVQEASRGS